MKDYLNLLSEAEAKYGLPSGLLRAQMEAESNGNPQARSPKGAIGLMQFMPDTAAELGIDPNDPMQSIDGAGRYMQKLMKSTGNVRDAVAAYNWGIGNLQRKGMKNAPSETMNYITKVQSGMKKYANGLSPISTATAGDYVTDPALLKQLNTEEYVTDPALLSQLNAPEVPTAPKQEKRGFMGQVGRQFGLAGRDIIEGGLETVGLVSDPLAGLSNRFLGTNMQTAGQLGANLADDIGLPAPETEAERILNSGAKLMVGTSGFVKGGKALANVTEGGVRKGMEMIAARPGMQAVSAVGAGTAGQASKESGDGFGGQLAATILGGVAAPGIVGLARNGANTVTNMFKSITPQRIDDALAQAGVALSTVPRELLGSLRDDVEKALRISPDISPDRLRRLIDYRITGLTPMRSNLSLNPVEITQDQNLAKMAANSNDPVAQQLSLQKGENNAKLITNLNQLGADTIDDAYQAGKKIISAVDGRNTKVKGAIDKLYDKARATVGRDAELDPSYFTNRFNDLIDFNNLGDVLSTKFGGIVTKLNNIAQGKIPLTVDVAEQLKTSIGKLQRNEADGNVRTALGIIRQSLDETPLLANQNMGQGSIDAFNVARRANYKWMQIVEKTPVLQAIRDGVEPDQFVKKYIIGMENSVKDIENLKRIVKSAPEANNAIRSQIALHLKNKALNGAKDEVGTFSQKAFNSALEAIGNRKLSLFFTQAEVDQLRAIGRVASYETFQGAGSAVNNSNSAAAVFTAFIDKVINSQAMRSQIPFANILSESVQKQIVSGGAKNALNVPKQLALKGAKPKGGKVIPLGLLPSLSAEQNSD